MTSPRISVICPTYQQPWMLPHALNSIASQDIGRDAFELIVIDDGSPDDTASVLGRWCQRNRSRCNARPYRLLENRGTAGAINAGISLATGAYLTWISSDNLMVPSFLSRLARELDAGAGVAYGGFHYIPCDQAAALDLAKMREPDRELAARQFGQYMHEAYEPGKQIAREECYLGPAHLIRREVWADHEGRIAHDLAHFLRVEENCLRAGLRLVGVNEPLCYYVAHEARATVTRRHEYDAPAHLEAAKKRRGIA